MRDATDNKLFGSGLTGIDEVCKHIDYIIDDILVLFYKYDLRIESFIRYKNMI